MAAPSTVSASGYFLVKRAGTNLGEGLIRMQSADKGTLMLGSTSLGLSGDPVGKALPCNRCST